MIWWQYVLEIIVFCVFLWIIMNFVEFIASKFKKLPYFAMSKEEREAHESLDRMFDIVNKKNTSRFKYASSGLTKKIYYRPKK